MNESEWLLMTFGPNWVLARRTARIVERYGEDVRCVTPTQYKKARQDFFASNHHVCTCRNCGRTWPQ